MFSKLASIVSQFSENEVTLDTTFRENKGELNADMGEIAKDLVASQLLVDLEDFDTTPFMNDMAQVKKGLRDLNTANQKDLDTLRKECYQELLVEIGEQVPSDEVAQQSTHPVEHKAYLPCTNHEWAFEITFTRGQKEPRYTGIIPLMKKDGTMHAVPVRPGWWKSDGTSKSFPYMETGASVAAKMADKGLTKTTSYQAQMWQFWCNLNNPFSDE